MVLEKTLESPLDSKEIKPVHPKRDHAWIFNWAEYIRRADAEAEVPVLWPPDVKGQLIGKDPDAGKDWGQDEKGRQRISRLNGIPDSVPMSWANCRQCWRTGKPGMLHFPRVTKSQAWHTSCMITILTLSSGEMPVYTGGHWKYCEPFTWICCTPVKEESIPEINLRLYFCLTPLDNKVFLRLSIVLCVSPNLNLWIK